MRFKRSCSLGVAAAIGMSVLAGAAAAKEMTTGLSFDFNRNDSGFTPIFPTTPTSTVWRSFMSFAPANMSSMRWRPGSLPGPMKQERRT